MSDPKRQTVLNAFRPNAAIDVPSVFAGRRAAISELTDAIRTHGSCPLIFGERGLGKTSLAFQIQRIALGDVELLENLHLSDRALGETETFTTFYIVCSDEVSSKEQLLQRIINTAQGFQKPPRSRARIRCRDDVCPQDQPKVL